MALITANEARELVQNSDVELQKSLTYIGTQIEKCATAGKYELLLDEVYSDKFKPTNNQFEKPVIGIVQQRIIEVLKTKGYIVETIHKTHSFGGGLGSMDDEPYQEERWHLQVKW